jgi:hypothetical protein
MFLDACDGHGAVLQLVGAKKGEVTIWLSTQVFPTPSDSAVFPLLV